MPIQTIIFSRSVLLCIVFSLAFLMSEAHFFIFINLLSIQALCQEYVTLVCSIDYRCSTLMIMSIGSRLRIIDQIWMLFILVF